MRYLPLRCSLQIYCHRLDFGLYIFYSGWISRRLCRNFYEIVLWVSWLVYAALGKGASTLVKYFMQAFHNYNRKSVTGVSPLAIAIDLSGATLALIQMQLDSSIADAGFFLFDSRMNLAKLLLCLFSGAFDAIILI